MDALDELRARADAGDSAAMTAYGKARIAQGDAPSIHEGVGYIQRAAASDNAEACAQLAVFAATGVAGPASWEQSFSLLQRAAERGWADAQSDLRFLTGGEGDDFAALRARVDIGAWLKPPPPASVRKSPGILTCAGFMSPDECARLIARAKPKLARADVYDPATGDSAVSNARSNTKMSLALLDFDLPLVLMLARISTLLRLPPTNFEPTSVLHYNPGEEFTAHYDFLTEATPGLAADKRQYGQRIVTFLVYLNDDFEGGETAFPRIGYAFKGRTGDALMFANVDPQGEPDPGTLHAGAPPTRGEKWLMSQWVRDRPLGGARA